MIHSIQLCLKHSGRVNNRQRVTFTEGLNVVVGPNGSGKSSLLEAVAHCPDCRRDNSSGTRYHYFNSETMNPHSSEDSFRGPSGALIKVRAMFSSHGETMRDVLRNFDFRSGDCFLLDEPEAGHDLGWVIKIHKGLLMISRSGCQVIAASHHPVFWRGAHIIELKRGYHKKAWKAHHGYLCGDGR